MQEIYFNKSYCSLGHIKKSCSFQILISLTTEVWPGYCDLKSEVAALNWCWCCHVEFCYDAPPSTYCFYQSWSQ